MSCTVFAVHVPDNVVGFPWVVGGWLALAALLAYGLRGLDDEAIPRTGLLTAALFVATLLHVPVGPASVHLLLNGVAGVVLGRHAVVAVTVALVLQALLFAHGGLTTVGVNGVVMAAPALLARGVFVMWIGQELDRRSVAAAGGVVGAGAAALTVALNAAVLLLGMRDDSTVLAGVIFVAHLPVVAAEGAISAAVLSSLAVMQPGWLLPKPATPPAA